METNDFNKYQAMYGDKYIRQLELEEAAKADAEHALKATWERARINGESGQGKLGGKFIEYAHDNCRANIHALIEEVKHPRKTTQGEWKTPMEDALRVYRDKEEELEDIIVTIALSITIDKVNAGLHAVSGIAMSIGHDIKDEVNAEKFIQWEVSQGTDGKWLSKSLQEGISKRVRKSYKLAYATNRMNKEGYTGLSWSSSQILALGTKIVEMVVKGSGYWEMSQSNMENGKRITSIEMTEWFNAAWQTNENNLLGNVTAYPPCIIPPRPWTSPYDGGYYGAGTLRCQLIRLHPSRQTKFMKRYKELLDTVDMSRVYKAINAMQETAFKVNLFILQTLKDIIATGGELGGVPRTEPLEIPAKLPEDASEEDLKAHKQKLVGIYKAEEARKSKALRCLMALKTAEKYAKEDEVYFPWNIDYRGRCYPISTTLSPQGDDIQKSLLVFAHGTPIKEDDWKWMAIHGANLAGHDKIPFADRIKWVVDNTDNIVASAEDPLVYTWWYAESKGDYPMEFLAFCNEWKNLQEYHKIKQEYQGFVSNLPLAFDGTCSGLQHFSALLRDEIGGHAVNLTKTDKVQDIYSLVADKVNVKLMEDVSKGTEDTFKTDKKTGEYVLDTQGNKIPKFGTKTLAQNWVAFNREKFGQDGITRKVCKRSVMTLAYGSKQYGFKENILTDILHPYVLAHPDTSVFMDASQAANYMSKLIWDAVGKTVVKAVEGMAWLQEVAGIIAKSGKVVTWMTPNGLPVQQNYMKEEKTYLRLRFNGARIGVYCQEPTEEVDSRSQKNGIAPNFIHSMDACHLQRVVGAEKDKGNNNFMMIHDSFGTDAAHAGSLYKTIREEFIGLYKDQNWLENFAKQVDYMIPEDAKVPEVPAFGNLDLDEVLNSDFCFA